MTTPDAPPASCAPPPLPPWSSSQQNRQREQRDHHQFQYRCQREWQWVGRGSSVGDKGSTPLRRATIAYLRCDESSTKRIAWAPPPPFSHRQPSHLIHTPLTVGLMVDCHIFDPVMTRPVTPDRRGRPLLVRPNPPPWRYIATAPRQSHGEEWSSGASSYSIILHAAANAPSLNPLRSC
jgi:hypothetical protein